MGQAEGPVPIAIALVNPPVNTSFEVKLGPKSLNTLTSIIHSRWGQMVKISEQDIKEFGHRFAEVLSDVFRTEVRLVDEDVLTTLGGDKFFKFVYSAKIPLSVNKVEEMAMKVFKTDDITVHVEEGKLTVCGAYPKYGIPSDAFEDLDVDEPF